MADDELELPIAGATVHRATRADAAELMVLQRCCWVDEAIANETLEIAPLTESLDVVADWIESWNTWCVRLDGRLIGAVRARLVGTAWEIGRLMVAPDLAGKGLGRWLLAFVESQAPAGTVSLELFTGAKSVRNLAMYERSGYRRSNGQAPPTAVSLAKPVPA